MEKIKPVGFGDATVRALVEAQTDTLAVHGVPPAHRAQWGPVPLLALEVHDNRLRRTERSAAYRLDAVQPVSGGVRVTVSLRGQHVSVGLWVGVRDGELVVRLAPDEVYERKPEVFRVFAVDILPGLSARGARGATPAAGQSRHAVFPGGSTRAGRDRFLAYMEQDRWELTSSLPLCGAADSAGGMVALATEGEACDAECRVETDGRDRGTVGFACSLRRRWPDRVDQAACVPAFLPLKLG